MTFSTECHLSYQSVIFCIRSLSCYNNPAWHMRVLHFLLIWSPLPITPLPFPQDLWEEVISDKCHPSFLKTYSCCHILQTRRFSNRPPTETGSTVGEFTLTSLQYTDTGLIECYSQDDDNVREEVYLFVYGELASRTIPQCTFDWNSQISSGKMLLLPLTEFGILK